MRFQLDSSSLTNFVKAGVTSVIALAIFAACSDTVAPPSDSVRPPAAGVYVVETQVPESEKNPPEAFSGSQLRAPGSAAMLVAPSGLSSSLAVAEPYAVSAVAFAPEAAPTENNGPICDDCVMFNVPLGFEFAFYGVAYSTLNISSNGFVGFGTSLGNGCCKGGMIPSNDITNNIIALGWSDWRPQLVSGGIKYETRGEAPNRRFVLQFNNVPEFGTTTGKLTVQLVLEEETNEITIHTKQLATFRSDHLVTQGIENASGTLAAYLSGRVRTFLKLTDDAVKFSPAPNARPVLSIPADISLDLEIGSCSRNVDVGTATATDDTEGFVITSERSDLLPLSEPYPAGVTIVKWTVTDAGGLKVSADQTVTLKESVNPSITAPANVSANNDPGLGSAVVDAGAAVAEDNCPGYVSVEAVRSDALALSDPYPVGVTTITWKAVDVSGNSAVATQTVTVYDVEAPVFASMDDISVDATNRDGAVVSFATSATDNVAVTSISCSPASGSFFPVGSTTVTCTASDAADNRASASFVVTVVGPADHLAALIAMVEAADLSAGVENPLLNQLKAALDGLDGPDVISSKKIDDFIKLLSSSKTRSELSAEEYDALMTYALKIEAMLDG